MDMIALQDALDDVRPHPVAGLIDDLAALRTHRGLQHLVAIFRDPHDLEPVVGSPRRGSRGRIIRMLPKRTGRKPGRATQRTENEWAENNR